MSRASAPTAPALHFVRLRPYGAEAATFPRQLCRQCDRELTPQMTMVAARLSMDCSATFDELSSIEDRGSIKECRPAWWWGGGVNETGRAAGIAGDEWAQPTHVGVKSRPAGWWDRARTTRTETSTCMRRARAQSVGAPGHTGESGRAGKRARGGRTTRYLIRKTTGGLATKDNWIGTSSVTGLCGVRPCPPVLLHRLVGTRVPRILRRDASLAAECTECMFKCVMLCTTVQ